MQQWRPGGAGELAAASQPPPTAVSRRLPLPPPAAYRLGHAPLRQHCRPSTDGIQALSSTLVLVWSSAAHKCMAAAHRPALCSLPSTQLRPPALHALQRQHGHGLMATAPILKVKQHICPRSC